MVRGFLTPAEKRALINHHRSKLDYLLAKIKDEPKHLDSEVERNVVIINKRINFIVEHF